MTIRPMQASDLPAVLALTRAVPEAPWWSEAHIRQFVGEEESGPLVRRAWVAIDIASAAPVHGFIVLQALYLPAGATRQPLECEIESIVVDANFRRQGVGGRLLETALVWSLERGASLVRLEVRSRNAAAIRLYQQAGFVESGLRRDYYHAPPDDAVLMELRLPSL
jgi:ribosomal-protein-alanine N-acetyltransferase